VILAGLSFSFWYSGWFGDLVKKPASAIPAVTATAHETTPIATASTLPASGATHGAVAHEATPASHDVSGPRTERTGGHAAAHGGESDHDAHLAHTAHTWAMFSSVAVGTLGISLAFVVYFFGWVNPERVAAAFSPVHTFLRNKWYFDELYEATAVNGMKALSRGLGWFDLHVVDGLVNLCAQLGVWASFLVGKFDDNVVDGAVNGMATVTIESGSFFRRFQTGKLYHYVFVLAGGILIIYLVKAF
jgi:NADH-quinone oxidoreductase subunit L